MSEIDFRPWGSAFIYCRPSYDRRPQLPCTAPKSRVIVVFTRCLPPPIHPSPNPRPRPVHIAVYSLILSPEYVYAAQCVLNFRTRVTPGTPRDRSSGDYQRTVFFLLEGGERRGEGVAVAMYARVSVGNIFLNIFDS